MTAGREWSGHFLNMECFGLVVVGMNPVDYKSNPGACMGHRWLACTVPPLGEHSGPLVGPL